MSWLVTFVSYLERVFLRDPLWRMYMIGPTALWCLANRPLEDLCSDLTGVPSLHWAENMGECHALVHSQFDQLYVTVTTLVYFVLLIRVLMFVCEGLLRWLFQVRVPFRLPAMRLELPQRARWLSPPSQVSSKPPSRNSNE